MGKRYSPSNKFNLFLVLLFFSVGTFLSFIITGTTAFIGLWLAPPYSGMVLVFISSWAIYWIQKLSIKYSKNRNVTLTRIVILTSSLLTIFFHMASIASIRLIMEDSIREIILSLNFQTIFDIFIGSIALFSQPMSVIKSFFGENVGASWAVYFFVIIISNVLIPQFAAEQAAKPFSEKTLKWMQEVYSLGRFEPFPDREQHFIVSAMKREDIIPFIERPRCNAQDPVDYGLLIFYKSANAHSGYVGVRHYHQVRNSDGSLMPDNYQMIEFIPPIQVGTAFALKLETVINSTAMIGHLNYQDDEHGYKLYRTAAEAADFQYNIKRSKKQISEAPPIQYTEELFAFHDSELKEDDYKPYNPALNPTDKSQNNNIQNL